MQGTIRLHVSFGVWRLILSSRLMELQSNSIKAELNCTSLPLGLDATDIESLLQESDELFVQVESLDQHAPIPTCRCKLQDFEIFSESFRFRLQPLNNFNEIQDLIAWMEMPLGEPQMSRSQT